MNYPILSTDIHCHRPTQPVQAPQRRLGLPECTPALTTAFGRGTEPRRDPWRAGSAAPAPPGQPANDRKGRDAARAENPVAPGAANRLEALGGDFPSGGCTDEHGLAWVRQRCVDSWGESVRLSQPPEQGVDIEQKGHQMRKAASSMASSSSIGRGASRSTGAGRSSWPWSTPGWRLGSPSLATTMVSPAWAASINREN